MKSIKTAGIDFGDRCSRIALMHSGVPSMLTEEPFASVPSCVYLDGSICHVGRDAETLASADLPGYFFEHFKYALGTQCQLAEIEGVIWDASMASALVLRKLRQMSEEMDRRTPQRTAIGVPAWFSNTARNELLFVAGVAGFPSVCFVDEARAAARYIHWVTDTPPESLVIVDGGAGPVTVSCFASEDDYYHEIDHVTDYSCSGWTVLTALAERCLSEPTDRGSETHGDADSLMRHCRSRISEVLPRLASLNREAAWISMPYNGCRTRLPLTPSLFDAVAEPAVGRILQLVQDCCDHSGVTLSRNTQIHFLGGFCSLPRIRESLKKRLGLVDNPSGEERFGHCVALGAALLAAEVEDEDFLSDLQQDSSVHADLCLQVRGHEGDIDNRVLVPEGTRLPAVRQVPVYTDGSGKQWLDFSFTQSGNGDPVTLCEQRFGPVVSTGTSPHRIDLSVTYDLSGGINLTVCDPVSGRTFVSESREHIGGDRIRGSKRVALEGVTLA